MTLNTLRKNEEILQKHNSPTSPQLAEQPTLAPCKVSILMDNFNNLLQNNSITDQSLGKKVNLEGLETIFQSEYGMSKILEMYKENSISADLVKELLENKSEKEINQQIENTNDVINLWYTGKPLPTLKKVLMNILSLRIVDVLKDHPNYRSYILTKSILDNCSDEQLAEQIPDMNTLNEIYETLTSSTSTGRKWYGNKSLYLFDSLLSRLNKPLLNEAHIQIAQSCTNLEDLMNYETEQTDFLNIVEHYEVPSYNELAELKKIVNKATFYRIGLNNFNETIEAIQNNVLPISILKEIIDYIEVYSENNNLKLNLSFKNMEWLRTNLLSRQMDHLIQVLLSGKNLKEKTDMWLNGGISAKEFQRNLQHIWRDIIDENIDESSFKKEVESLDLENISKMKNIIPDNIFYFFISAKLEEIIHMDNFGLNMFEAKDIYYGCLGLRSKEVSVVMEPMINASKQLNEDEFTKILRRY